MGNDHGPGLAEAAAEFLERSDAFVRDQRRETFLLTFNPGGYLETWETATGNTPRSSSLDSRLLRHLRSGGRPADRPASA